MVLYVDVMIVAAGRARDSRHEHTPADGYLMLMDSLDDWQHGFLDAVFAAQNIDTPTPAQCSAALKRMTSYVMQKHGGELPPHGRMSLARQPDSQ